MAAATPEGRLVAFQGDPGAATFLRSADKPFQGLPLLLAGAAERYGLEAADIALICASHGGTPAHVDRSASLLARGGFGVEDLLCGAHWPMDAAAAQALKDEGREPSPLHNNCSGKHAGMLLACRMLGLPTETYLAPDHPWQQRILGHVLDFFRLSPQEIGFGVDGCSVPTYRVPLLAAARAYAALADPGQAGITGETAAAVETIVRSMTGAPEMVAGPGRFTTRLMEATGGRVLAKEGAFDGIERGLPLGAPAAGDLGHLSADMLAEQGIALLPRTAHEALAAVAADEVVMAALGPVIGPEWLRVKRSEMDTYDTVVSPWEREVYLRG